MRERPEEILADPEVQELVAASDIEPATASGPSREELLALVGG